MLVSNAIDEINEENLYEKIVEFTDLRINAFVQFVICIAGA